MKKRNNNWPYIITFLFLLTVGCRGVVERKDFDDCIKAGNDCVSLGWRFSRENDTLRAIITEYRNAQISNYRNFGLDERFILINK